MSKVYKLDLFKKCLVLVCACMCFSFADVAKNSDAGSAEARDNKAEVKKAASSSYEGVRFVAPRAAYAKRYVKWWTTEKALKFNTTQTLTVDYMKQKLEILGEWQEKEPGNLNSYVWFTKEEKSGEIVATAGLEQISWLNKTAYANYAVSEEHQRKGIGRKTCYLLLEKAFDELGFEKIYVTVALDNVASQKIVKGYGFQHEGVLRGHYKIGKGRIDLEILGLFADEWKKVKQKLNSEKGK